MLLFSSSFFRALRRLGNTNPWTLPESSRNTIYLLTLQTHCPNNWYEYDHSKQPDYLKLIRKFPWLNNDHPVPARLCLCFELEKELNKFILGASHLHTNMTMDKLESSLHLKSVHSYGSQFRFMLQMMRTLYEMRFVRQKWNVMY